MSKHTPGPWEIKHSESKNAFNILGTMPGVKYKIARVPYLLIDGGGFLNERHKKEAEVDAKLIAAAPELLEACEWALHSLELLGYEGPENSTIGKLKSAIEKARP